MQNVGVIGVGDGGKKTTKKNQKSSRILGTVFLFFSGNRKTDFKKSVFGREKTAKPTEKNDFRFSVHNPAAAAAAVAAAPAIASI